MKWFASERDFGDADAWEGYRKACGKETNRRGFLLVQSVVKLDRVGGLLCDDGDLVLTRRDRSGVERGRREEIQVPVDVLWFEDFFLSTLHWNKG